MCWSLLLIVLLRRPPVSAKILTLLQALPLLPLALNAALPIREVVTGRLKKIVNHLILLQHDHAEKPTSAAMRLATHICCRHVARPGRDGIPFTFQAFHVP